MSRPSWQANTFSANILPLLLLATGACQLTSGQFIFPPNSPPFPPPNPPSAAIISSLAVPYQNTACSAAKFFDISTLQCASCPAGFFPSTDQLSCITCDGSSGSSFNFVDGVTESQTWVSSSSVGAGVCVCGSAYANRSVIALAVVNGVTEQRCVVCPVNTTANSVTGRCVSNTSSNNATTTTDTITQLSRALLTLNAGISVQAAIQASISVPNTNNDATITLGLPQSQPLVNLLGPAALNCYNSLGVDRESCNVVANLCVLQLYDSSAASCILYQNLVNAFTSTGVIGGTRRRTVVTTRQDTGAMPWLYYDGATYSVDKNMALRVQFDGGSLEDKTASTLQFVLSSFALNGTWLGFHNWTSQFQLCGAPKQESSKWHRFGWNYVNKCSVGLQDVLEEIQGSSEPTFYELFIRDSATTLYPLPVRIGNKDSTDSNTDTTLGAVRRFFYVDSALGTSATTGANLVVQFPTAFTMNVTLMSKPRDAIYPPYLYIQYSAWQLSTASSSSGGTPTQAARFAVLYRNEASLNDRFWYAWQTILIVFLVALGFPVLMWKIIQYLRKHRTDGQDQGLLVYAVLCVCDVGSFALCFVLLFVSIYYVILNKLQQQVYFLMLPDGDLKNFIVTVVLAVVGQALAMVYLLWQQTNVDVFFIDWERPREVLTNDGDDQEYAPVSAWRMLLVANEWNELQTVRVTSPGFTLLMLVLILEGNNLISAGYVAPNRNNFTEYRNVQTSMILRFGITAAFLLVLFAGQWLFKRLIYYPYINNPVTRLVDLMFLANISAVVLDDKTSGYYIHGRNQCTHSDTTLRELNHELLKEEEGLVAHRGLVTDNQAKPKLNDNQLFIIHLTEGIRRTYDDRLLQQIEQAVSDQRLKQGYVQAYFKGIGKQERQMLDAHDKISVLFKDVIRDVGQNHAVQVVDPTYLQMVLQLPPEASSQHAVFLHDYQESFTSTMFVGNEVRLFVFESIFLLSIDMGIRNVAVSALLTYILIRAIAWLRQTAGENNLSRKTLVDKHFFG